MYICGRMEGQWVCTQECNGHTAPKKVSNPLKLGLQALVSCLHWCWESNSVPLQEQYMLFIAEPRLRSRKLLLIQLLDTQLSSPSSDIFPASDICHRLPYLYEIHYFSFFTGVSTDSICLLWHFTSPCCRKWQNSTPFYGWLIFLCVCTPHLLYSFISGDLGWLHILALMNSSAVNNRCQVSLQQTDVHSFVNVQLGNCCIIESCYQVLKEPAILVSLMTAPIYTAIYSVSSPAFAFVF